MSDSFMPDLRGVRHGVDTSATWYHGSPHHLKPGDIIEAGNRPANFEASPADAVSITSEPERALYWAREAGGDSVYEVELIAPTVAHRVGPKNYGRETAYFEVRTARVRVIRVIES